MGSLSTTGSYAVLLPLMGLTACEFLFPNESVGPARADNLVSRVERVHVESELSKERARAAFDALQAITAQNFGDDPVVAYSELVKAIELSKRQARKLSVSIESMRVSAEPVFRRWANDLRKFSSTEMRQRSRIRLSDTRSLYEEVVDAVEPAEKLYAELNRNLGDHVLFLNFDLNAGGIAEIRDEVRALANLAEELDNKLDVCLKTARRYVETAALPASPPPAPGSAGPSERPAAPRPTGGTQAGRRDRAKE